MVSLSTSFVDGSNMRVDHIIHFKKTRTLTHLTLEFPLLINYYYHGWYFNFLDHEC